MIYIDWKTQHTHSFNRRTGISTKNDTVVVQENEVCSDKLIEKEDLRQEREAEITKIV